MSRKKERAGLGSAGGASQQRQAVRSPERGRRVPGRLQSPEPTRASTTEALWTRQELEHRLNTPGRPGRPPGPGPGGQQPHRAAALGFRFLTWTWTCCLLLAPPISGRGLAAPALCRPQATSSGTFPHPAPEGPSFSL